jgi:hypothetical protein
MIQIKVTPYEFQIGDIFLRAPRYITLKNNMHLEFFLEEWKIKDICHIPEKCYVKVLFENGEVLDRFGYISLFNIKRDITLPLICLASPE